MKSSSALFEVKKVKRAWTPNNRTREAKKGAKIRGFFEGRSPPLLQWVVLPYCVRSWRRRLGGRSQGPPATWRSINEDAERACTKSAADEDGLRKVLRGGVGGGGTGRGRRWRWRSVWRKRGRQMRTEKFRVRNLFFLVLGGVSLW
ncbi:hypothetical protein GWI33_010422 [Rhynchophorus ferrugineus]|uniref:Uncharacterized protein n=1 Tax=Rhynchophorus ferrugineus TaxID=354439 RepID=A0A834IR35_RHYFE|nr:hypothetical protein GWI33_010422 [Rhynchophorus ferrugineus]